ncbi:DUF333 domain-containing protein [Pseudorhodobacter ferrugineus]|uniref:putative hemolysin n=2 Tax=Pseudorhodobacter ferrugineus TaxID=77008 RepID=UPI000524DF55|nr:DUF333 domain-containing protein [Pseudorhodobacter ferrugineus]
MTMSVFFMAACKDEQQRSGLANPASVYCQSLGGVLEIRTEANGQTGYCTLPDGRIVEEWELFKEKS